MYKTFVVLLFFTAPVFSGQLCAVDDSQSEVCLPEPAKRIITFSPHATELIYFVGAGDNLIGVIDGSRYPKAATEKESVGNYQSVSIEKIISLQPDLVVVWPSGNSAKTLAQLQGLDIAIYHSEPAGVQGVVENVEELAILTGTKNNLSQLTQGMLNKHDDLKYRYHKKREVRALILVSAKPLITLSEKHAVNKAFELCRAENVFKTLPVIAPTISKESLLVSAPDLIVTTFVVKEGLKFLANLGFDGKNKPELGEIDPDIILQQSPRMLSGIEELCTLTDRVRSKNMKGNTAIK